MYLKVDFHNVSDLTAVRSRVEKMVKRNATLSDNHDTSNTFAGSLSEVMARGFDDYNGIHNTIGDDCVIGGNSLDRYDNSDFNSTVHRTSSVRWMDWVQDIREYDVKYYMRVAIDLKVFCGSWYKVLVEESVVSVERYEDSAYPPAMPRVVAFDIETTKAPLRFPQP